MLNNYFKKRAIRKYILILPLELSKRYGGHENTGYTVAQVTKTVEELKLSMKYIDLALALFCNEETLLDYGLKSSELHNITKYLGIVSCGGYVGLDDTVYDSVHSHGSHGFHDGYGDHGGHGGGHGSGH